MNIIRAVLIYLLLGLIVFAIGRKRFRLIWSRKVFTLVVLFWPFYLDVLL